MSDPASDKELPLLKQFRDELRTTGVKLRRELYESDAFLLRWLRARDLDVPKSLLMLTNSLKWREENRVDQVLAEPISKEWLDIIDGFFGGLDKYGRLVIALPGGSWDVRKPLDDGRKDELVRFTINLLEILECTMWTMWREEYPKATLLPHTQFTVIIDLKHFSYAKVTHKKSIETLIEVVKIYEANYPETLGRCIIINSPRIFSMLFGMIKPFLSEKTVSKISIFDSNEKNWKKEVLELVDGDQLPPTYGGSNNNPTIF